ncbi:uncharacterized protein LOC143305686 [Osmia lignaria lignaria]|uniref:uncharacterized protein LOC143305686 n=1 Tax=Osmia lignaria lignaria TaxID=1437193 RepID=UPI00402B53F5
MKEQDSRGNGQMSPYSVWPFGIILGGSGVRIELHQESMPYKKSGEDNAVSSMKGKFELRSREGIFVGYAEQSKGYRIWIPTERKIEISRDARFLEKLPRKPEESIRDSKPVEITVQEGRADEELPKETISIDYESSMDNAPEEEGQPQHDNGEFQTETPKRGPGRPRILRTGLRGRPRKLFHPRAGETAQGNDDVRNDGKSSEDASTRDEIEIACTAEIPVKYAMSGDERDEWRLAMAEEVRAIVKNNAWDVVDRSTCRLTVGGRFVLRNKYNPDGSLQRRKARLVAQGFTQQPGVDFFESFAPVARLSSIRLVTALAAQYGMKIRQFDVSTAYLNGALEEDVFMNIPKFFEEALEEATRIEPDVNIRRRAIKMLDDIRAGNKVFHLKKALYGLRQAGRSWYRELDRKLRDLGAKPSNADLCIYRMNREEDVVIIAVYVDDILVAARRLDLILQVKDRLRKSLEINDLGEVERCVGIEFARDDKKILIHQKGYIRDLLKYYGMSECRPGQSRGREATFSRTDRQSYVSGGRYEARHCPHGELSQPISNVLRQVTLDGGEKGTEIPAMHNRVRDRLRTGGRTNDGIRRRRLGQLPD